jgi:hypothetical protein
MRVINNDLRQKFEKYLPLFKSKPTDTLTTLFQRPNGKPAAKWQGYLQHYDRLFSSFKKKPLRLLEIGVQAGGSLEVWAQYFDSARIIVGCDVDKSCGDLRYEDPRIKVLIGDINTNETLQSLALITEVFDIVIDDGSHQSDDIIHSFIQLFPLLTEGGIYLIEDLHCSYWEDYGGGLYDPLSSISFFKKIVDMINQSVWGVKIEPSVFFREFKNTKQDNSATDLWNFLSDIHSIEFVNSMCIIHKRSKQNNMLGTLSLSGSLDVNNNVSSQYLAAEISVPDQTKNIFSKPSIDLVHANAQLSIARDEINRLRQIIFELQSETATLTTQFYESTSKFYEASVIIQQLEFKLNSLSPTPSQADSTN